VIEYGGPQGEWGATYPDFSCQFSANSTNDLEGKWGGSNTPWPRPWEAASHIALSVGPVTEIILHAVK